MAFIASRESLPRLAVWAVIVLNGLWVVESLVTLMSSAVAPNALGYVFVIVQAAFVAVLAELEYVGLKRSESPRCGVSDASSRATPEGPGWLLRLLPNLYVCGSIVRG